MLKQIFSFCVSDIKLRSVTRSKIHIRSVNEGGAPVWVNGFQKTQNQGEKVRGRKKEREWGERERERVKEREWRRESEVERERERK